MELLAMLFILVVFSSFFISTFRNGKRTVRFIPFGLVLLFTIIMFVYFEYFSETIIVTLDIIVAGIPMFWASLISLGIAKSMKAEPEHYNEKNQSKYPLRRVIPLMMTSLIILFLSTSCSTDNDFEVTLSEKAVIPYTVVEDIQTTYKKQYDPIRDGEASILCSTDLSAFSVMMQQNLIEAEDLDYFKGVYIEVGRDAIKTSLDTKNWTKLEIGVNGHFCSVAHSDNVIVIIDDGGIILTSNDLKHWTKQYLEDGHAFSKVRYINGRFFIVGVYGTLLMSENGIDWSLQTFRTNYHFNDIAWNNGQYTIVGGLEGYIYFELNSGQNPVRLIMTSNDGIEWNHFVEKDEADLKSVISYQNRFLVGNSPWKTHSGYILSMVLEMNSEEASQLTPIIQKIQDGQISDFAVSGDVIVGVGEGIFFSSDGVDWVEVNKSTNLKSVIYDGKKFVALGKYGDVLSSTDGQKWETICIGDFHINDIIFTGNKYIASGTRLISGGLHNDRGMLLTSTDGMNWAQLDRIMSSYISYDRIAGITKIGQKYYTTTGFSKIQVSDDSVNWSEINMNTSSRISKLATAGEVILGLGYYGHILKSTNGISFETIDLSQALTSELEHHSVKVSMSFRINDAAWNGTQVALACNHTTIITSKDTIKWDIHHLDGYCEFNSIAWGNGKFLALSSAASAVSEDGENWEFIYHDGMKLTDIIFSDGKFIAIGNYGEQYNNYWGKAVILTSEDGIQWNVIEVPTKGFLKKIIWDGKQYIIVSNMASY